MRLRRMDTTVFLLVMMTGFSHGNSGYLNVTKDDENQNMSASIVKKMPDITDSNKIALLTDPLPEGAIAYPKIGGSSRCTTCLKRTSKYCCKTPKGRCCDYGYEPPKNNIIRFKNNVCAERTTSTVCSDLTNRTACLTSTESRRNSSVPGYEIYGQDCAWCPHGPCLGSNGNMDPRCQPEILLLAKTIRGIETCLPKKGLIYKGTQGSCPAGAWTTMSNGRATQNRTCCSGCPGGTSFCYSDCGCKCSTANTCEEITRENDGCVQEHNCVWEGSRCVSRPDSQTLAYEVTKGQGCYVDTAFSVWNDGSNAEIHTFERVSTSEKLQNCERICNAHPECAGFNVHNKTGNCGHWLKNPFRFSPSSVRNCHRKVYGCFDKYLRYCSIRKHLCSHDFKVKTHCKKTCNTCGKCVDEDPEFCRAFKNSCETDWDVQKVCKATCSMCD